MTSIRLSRSMNQERTRCYQDLLYPDFPDVEAQVTAAHQKHAVHQEFLRRVLDRDCTPMAFDHPRNGGVVIRETPAQSRG